MSLESAITENTAAVQALTAALLNRSDINVDDASAHPHKTAKKQTNRKAETTQVSSSSQTDAAPDLYQQAATAITTLSRQKGREAALEVLAIFGATKLPAVLPERLQEVITAAEQALGAGE